MKNANGVTHTARVRAQYHADERAVLFFTGMSLDSLTDFKLDTGKAWLTKYCLKNGVSREDAEELWMEPLLMQWWNLEWRRMDHHIILPMIHKITEGHREEVYKDMHIEVFGEEHPSYTMLELALGKMYMKMKRAAKQEELIRR